MSVWDRRWTVIRKKTKKSRKECHPEKNKTLIIKLHFSTTKTIRSDNHQLGSNELNKVLLSCFDDKSYINQDGVTTSTYEHYET